MSTKASKFESVVESAKASVQESKLDNANDIAIILVQSIVGENARLSYFSAIDNITKELTKIL